jgi:hypothetical protein
VHVAKVVPSLSVSCSPNPITYGQTSTCTAQTSSGTGTINTYWDGNGWCSGAAPGPIVCTGWNTQLAGNHSFSASYSGDSNYGSASASTVLTINKATPNITVSCSPNPISYGPQTSNCTAIVSGGATGTVSFHDNGSAPWSTPTLSNGQASAGGFNYDTVGTHTVTVDYSGDGNFNLVSGSTSLVINKAAPSVNLSCTPNTLKVGQQTTCTASIPGATGMVTFYSPTTLTGQWWNGDSNSWYLEDGRTAD